MIEKNFKFAVWNAFGPKLFSYNYVFWHLSTEFSFENSVLKYKICV